MTKTSEFRTKPSKPLISGAAKAVFLPASHTEVPLNRGGLPVTAALELDLNPAWDARCLWCSRTFTPRATGGSAQRFCCTGHRQQFWIAARRWTIRQSRRAYTLGRLSEGTSGERARCPREGGPKLGLQSSLWHNRGGSEHGSEQNRPRLIFRGHFDAA
jgi:hypothetical protein